LGRRGRKRRLSVEDEYWKLILEGVGTVEASRLVGIGRKTGYRWRAERGGLPPLRLGEADRRGRYLSQLERQRIATLRGRGLGVREIARRLGRAPSTVSRELRRNVRPHDAGVYDGDLAHARSRERARRNRAGRLAADPELRQVVQDKLEWSGARSRSPPGCASPIPTGRPGTSATRRSTRRSITAGRAG
jgi:transposase, IS30 family